MASSTEEVSVAPGDTANDRTADDVTSSEKQFAVFKDFDFLEYELESQGVSSFCFSSYLLLYFIHHTRAVTCTIVSFSRSRCGTLPCQNLREKLSGFSVYLVLNYSCLSWSSFVICCTAGKFSLNFQ